jgi:hypothetical protein
MGSDYPFDMGSPDPVAAVGAAALDPGTRALVEGEPPRSSSASEPAAAFQSQDRLTVRPPASSDDPVTESA